MSLKPHKFLLAPLVYIAAILLLCEEWLWETSTRILSRLQVIALIARLESRISHLHPYAALAAFALPGLLLLPVKIIALMSIANGHAVTGLLVVIGAKILGTALVARLYVLTRSAMLTLPWFARGQRLLLDFKDRMIAQLRATSAWRRIVALRAALNQWRLRQRVAVANGTGNRLMRLVRKWAAIRRRKR